MEFTQSHKDLEVAEKAINIMASTMSFSDFEEAWQIFLYRIQRAWERCERKISKENGFQQWFIPYKKLRKNDSLLVFLKQARDAETHAVSGTIVKPLELLLQDKFNRPFHIDKIDFTFKDGVLEIDIKTPDHFLEYDLDVKPSDPKLVKFKNRGIEYNPPQKHLGNPIENLHPVVAAKLGLSFYRSFICEAEAKYSTIKN